MASTALMEPLLPEDYKHVLEELATELVDRASRLGGRIHPVLRDSLGNLVRAMNCYYSNLIEGHDTHPIDIDRALKGDYANDAKRRNLQIEAQAHIDVQRLVDEGAGPAPVVSIEFLLWVHREFCSRLPEELLWVTNPATGAKLPVVPGELRKNHVQVGLHIPPDPDDIENFLKRFVEAYQSKHLTRLRRIIGCAAAHHRLVWIHPFLDGNGRVARLFSYAWLCELNVGSSLWSVARGLARQVGEYKARLQAADEPRRGDLDGRGSLTLSGLEEFCAFFLRTCIDQVTFMEGLFEPAELLGRIEVWVNEEIRAGRLLKGSWPLLREAVMAGEYPRGQAAALTGYQDRQARTVLSKLLAAGVLVSDTEKGPVRLGLPITVVERWFPRLYPGIG
ncbi:Fic family protein [Mesorhizobium shonense]|uniref:Fic family protein n=1 Tax=Mesorhizobium shonense TaxID=1209948 RepID=A0ABV2HME5_9HYPH